MPAKKNNVKPKDFFSKDKNIISKEKKLKKLQKNKEEIEKSIVEIIKTFNKKSITSKDAENFLDRLPFENLKELRDFQNGKKKDSGLGLLKLRANLRKDQISKIEELRKIEEKISEVEKDLLLAKISCLMLILD